MQGFSSLKHLGGRGASLAPHGSFRVSLKLLEILRRLYKGSVIGLERFGDSVSKVFKYLKASSGLFKGSSTELT